MYIAIDDTDSRKGMCTTYLAAKLIETFPEYDLLGYPRLVRLNPNIPWKTRGNGAVIVRFGRGRGPKTVVARVSEKPYHAYTRGTPADIPKDAKKRVEKLFARYARTDAEGTNPGFVISRRKPPAGLYWQAVRTIVELVDVKKILKEIGATWGGCGNLRGVIGAASAMSWRPHDRTFEVITYRHEAKWGTKRRMNADSVTALDEKFPSTFNNYDRRNGIIAIAPASPCPVLFGIRGEKPGELLKAKDTVKAGEDYDTWILYKTNQGTDDHLQRMPAERLAAYDSAIVWGEVAGKAKTIPGGHASFPMKSGHSALSCAAYEPTKEFRRIVRALAPGDRVEVYGSVRSEGWKPGQDVTLNIEKLRVKSLAPQVVKVANPLCQKCEKRMKSVGKGQGFRCALCGARKDRPEMKELARELLEGFYEVPVCARRHLSKPLKRMRDIG